MNHPESIYDIRMRENPEMLMENLRIERERFGNILTDLLDKIEYQPPQRTLSVASIACGVFVEAPVLVDVFGHRDGERQVNLVGIDTDSRQIEIAAQQAASLPGRHTFTVGDGCKNAAYGNHEFDVALFRRQNIFNLPPAWAELFGVAMQRVARGGLAIMTSISASEHIMALGAFHHHGYLPVLEVPLATPYHRESRKPLNKFQLIPIDACASAFYPVYEYDTVEYRAATE